MANGQSKDQKRSHPRGTEGAKNCEQYTASRTHLQAHFFYRAWPKLILQCSLCALSPKIVIVSRACHVPLFAYTATDLTYTEQLYLIFNVVPLTPASHFHSANRTLVGRFAAHSLLTVYEPNAPVEVSSAEVTTTLMLSRRGSIGSTYNSGDDIATGPTPEISSARCPSQISASLPTFVPQRAKEAIIFRYGPSTLTEGTRLADGETLAGWCAVARSLHGRIDVMFGPVITTEDHLAFAGCQNSLQQHR